MARPSKRQSDYKPRHRDILPLDQFEQGREQYEQLAARVVYTGSPLHKSNPGDFGLTPPRDPRPDKTLCDKVSIFKRAKAQELLRRAFQRGVVSSAKARNNNAWPQYVWAVTDDGYPLEAAFDGTGYHGYPLPDERTPLFFEILKRWNDAI